MSQKNETAVLVFSLLVTVVLVAAGLWWFTSRSGSNLGNVAENQGTPNQESASKQSETQRISTGEKFLITSEATPEKQAAAKAIASGNYSEQEKQAAAKAIAAGNYSEAVAKLEKLRQANPNEPEALIYLNNARIGNQKSYTIAASVPIGTQVNTAKEILRGVAQAQTEINQKGGIKGIPLKVAIADDEDKPETAEKVASNLVKNPDILGVVGNFSSGATLASGKVYENNQLVLISPTSTSVQLSGFSKYVFRTVPSDRFAAAALSRYMLNKLKKQKAAVFFNSDSNYSKSLKNEFTTALFGDGGQVVSEFDFYSPNFDASESFQQAAKQGAEVVMLAADSTTLDKALQVVQVNNKRLQMLGGDSVYSPKTLQVGQDEGIGMVLAVPWHILAEPQAEFPKAADQLWGGNRVNWRTALAYDATKALIASIERNPTRTGVQQALSASDFSAAGAAGDIKFLPSGDRNRAVQLVTIQAAKSSFGYEFVPVP